jgi:hemolysin III
MPSRFRAREPVSGYTHLFGLVLGCVGAAFLFWPARAAPHASSATTSLVAYAVSLVGLYAASSAYHLVPARAVVVRRLRQLDHSAIFVFIAGTCTPVFVRAFTGATRAGMLGLVWALALGGIVLRVAWVRAPRAVTTAIYVAMGWLVLVDARTAVQALPRTVALLVLAGGVTYTAGAVVYALKRPDPVPGVFGFHEIWHLFVLGGSILHYAAIVVLAAS